MPVAPRRPRTMPSLVALLLVAVLGVGAARPGAIRGASAEPSASPLAAQPAGPALTLVGHITLGGQGLNADVAVLGSFAYVGSWGISIPDSPIPTVCPGLGVRIVDISDPTRPEMGATVARFERTTAEDVVALRVSTPVFRGDLLAVGIQRCGDEHAPAGLALVDVSDPRNPVELGFYDSGPSLHGVHELDVLVRGDQVLALLALPDEEETDEPEFRIVDVSDPRRPVLIASWDLQATLGPVRGQGCFPAPFSHSAKASRDGMRVYLSYWDGGIIILDIADPTTPRMIGRLMPPLGEGDYHSVDETADGLLLVAQEYPLGEPFPAGLFLRVEAGGATEEFYACEYRRTGPASIVRTGPIAGTLLSVSDACSLTADAAAGRVVLADLGGCSIAQKARQARTGGALALIVSTEASGRPEPLMREDALDLPMLGIVPEQFARLRMLAAAGSATVTLPTARPFGGIHVWDIRNPANPVLRGTFHTENARRFPPRAPGDYTAHNPLVVGKYALVSWYSDGVRLLDLTDPGNPREVAAFVPPAVPDPQDIGIFPPDAAEVWGVALAGDLVLLTDMHGGLYLLRLSGVPLPAGPQPGKPAPTKGD